ncbi:hypothetical protein AZE42_13140 [Rhizopogon vesiculosus]|uniref:Uncharacterized protein n=1 Tax=Rhizopogon vesiculosus TaxID=180088 RepID=A0A1J8QCA5_9AGAM|nr:hypothetical protein AZE42_13140 [Rhizopogon vesiculosus]
MYFGETLRAPVPPPPLRDTPSPTSLPPLSLSSSHDRTTSKRTIAPTPMESIADIQMVKYNDFAFPPRTASRSKSKLSTSVPTSTSTDIRMKEESTLSEDRATASVAVIEPTPISPLLTPAATAAALQQV